MPIPTPEAIANHADDLRELLASLVTVEFRRCACSDYDGRTHYWTESRVTPNWLVVQVRGEWQPRELSLVVNDRSLLATPFLHGDGVATFYVEVDG